MKAPAKNRTIRLTMTALLMALNIVFSSFGIPVPGGHLYLCDGVICLAAILLDPFEAFLVGGIGSFFGDMIFYPDPMFVSLVTHGIQAAVASYIAHGLFKEHPRASAWVGVLVGAVIMVIGYTLGKTFVYSTFANAIIKLPYEIAQGVLGAVLGVFLSFNCGLKKLFENYVGNYSE